MFTTKRLRAAGGFLLSGAAGLGLLLSLFFPGVMPWSPPEEPPAAVTDCQMIPFALDPADLTKPNPDKEVTGAFGPAVTARGEDDVKAALKERRSCGEDGVYDTYLTAAHYAEWSDHGLTTLKVDNTDAGITAFAEQVKADPALYKKTLTELEKLEGESKYSEESVPKGIWSMYMVPNGKGGVLIKIGRTSSIGTNAVFTHGDVVVRYRLDCGFQPNREGSPDKTYPNIPTCTGTECTPPQECKPNQTGTWPDCYDLKWQTPSPSNPGITVRGTDNEETNGQQSRDQLRSGETRRNAGTDQTPVGTNGSTGTDTPSNGDGGAGASGASDDVDDSSDDVQDEELVNDDDGGVEGDQCVPNPFDDCIED